MTTARIPWWRAEPARLATDQHDIGQALPSLQFNKDGQGAWFGRLPVWPFDRPAPPRLDELVPVGADIVLAYRPAYPIVFPYIFPMDPAPQPIELTQARWHVLGNGALCLFQTDADWAPASSVIDLLMKAAGWRIEYALMKAGMIEAMTLGGIVNDRSRDRLVPQAAARLAASPGEEQGEQS